MYPLKHPCNNRREHEDKEDEVKRVWFFVSVWLREGRKGKERKGKEGKGREEREVERKRDLIGSTFSSSIYFLYKIDDNPIKLLWLIHIHAMSCTFH